MDKTFLYNLKINSDLKDAKNDLESLDKKSMSATRSLNSFGSVALKASGGFAAFITGTKFIANSFRDIESISLATGESVDRLREIGQEFRIIGFEADKGTSLISNLSKQIKDFSIGEGNFESLGRLGIDPTSIKTTEGFITKLRESAERDITTFQREAPKLGLDTAQIKFLTQSQETFTENVALAKEQVKGTQESIDNAREFNKSFAELKAGFDVFGQSMLELGVALSPLISLISTGISTLAKVMSFSLKTLGKDSILEGVEGFKLNFQSKTMPKTEEDIRERMQINRKRYLANNPDDASLQNNSLMDENFNNSIIPNSIITNTIKNNQEQKQSPINNTSENKTITNSININVGSIDDTNTIFNVLNEAMQ